jgi:hypothetical protein
LAPDPVRSFRHRRTCASFGCIACPPLTLAAALPALGGMNV